MGSEVPLDQGWIALARDRFAFRYQSCDGGEILVCESPSFTNKSCYSFVFNPSDLTIHVTDTSGVVVVQQTFSTDVFSCGATWFWVSWRQGVLSFGKGEAICENLIGEEIELFNDQARA